jgi:3-deoxy-manno-octulosonate cytidylyltransferase (CMP-KDO synthetase)
MTACGYSVLVPARLESTRLPRKLLLSESGRTLLEHSLINLQPLREEAELWLVTDSEELAEKGRDWVDQVHVSTREFNSGTERIVEVLPKLKTEWVLNVQADEPEIEVACLQRLMAKMLAGSYAMGTLGAPFASRELWENPNAVKLLLDAKGCAFTFSRQPLPHGGGPDTPRVLQHLGVYAYRRQLLSQWHELPLGVFEKVERLEQLRALENGIPIVVEAVDCAHKGIDTEADYKNFVCRFLRD